LVRLDRGGEGEEGLAADDKECCEGEGRHGGGLVGGGLVEREAVSGRGCEVSVDEVWNLVLHDRSKAPLLRVRNQKDSKLRCAKVNARRWPELSKSEDDMDTRLTMKFRVALKPFPQCVKVHVKTMAEEAPAQLAYRVKLSESFSPQA
jgi:hypothetical protein